MATRRWMDPRHRLRWAPRCLPAYLVLAVSVASPCAWAAPPIEPLPAPYFSLDRTSPLVIGGTVRGSDVLQVSPAGPVVAIPGPALQVYMLADDLDALSGPNADVGPDDTFMLLISVDRNAVGAQPPDPVFVNLGVPYNVLNQAAKHQAAGDQFMIPALFTRSRGRVGGERTANTVLARNNFDEGGTSFGVQPPTSAEDDPGSVPQDNVDATGSVPTTALRSSILDVYFSLTSQSPSLYTLPGGQYPSGANIYYNHDPLHGTPTLLYAPFFELGLTSQDDIDAFIVFDANENGLFDPPDTVLFSLTGSSPSLFTIPGASPVAAAADVFFVLAGGSPMVFAHAASTGLGNSADNIDALDYALCVDPVCCAALHGIRKIHLGDLNCDGLVNNQDIDHFVQALFHPDRYVDEHDCDPYPPCDILNGDFTGDGLVNNQDIDGFVAALFASP